MTDDAHWMREAIAVAREKGDDPALSLIGAVIVRDGKLLARVHNRVADDCDATAHAEILAIRAAGAAAGDAELRGATLYTTLQPCGMCTMATIWSKVGRVVYGAGRDDVHSMYWEDRHIDTVDFVRDAWRDDLVYEGGVLREDCAALYFRPWDKLSQDQIGNT
ncbi:cytosine deaminase [Sphingomonas sp. Leaf17]|uniref:nucleoside deaminase n=1 Tax=Sphingomonas sp. Leaf17 TaxID=1735683 RepID=UPI0006F52F94|nr:nucleoside deaminase [Sphingomonas sp. Leaf17]KQM63342.1 cytosine deaminase [Sphingomonas sp. Leaf17]